MQGKAIQSRGRPGVKPKKVTGLETPTNKLTNCHGQVRACVLYFNGDCLNCTIIFFFLLLKIKYQNIILPPPSRKKHSTKHGLMRKLRQLWDCRTWQYITLHTISTHSEPRFLPCYGECVLSKCSSIRSTFQSERSRRPFTASPQDSKVASSQKFVFQQPEKHLGRANSSDRNVPAGVFFAGRQDENVLS